MVKSLSDVDFGYSTGFCMVPQKQDLHAFVKHVTSQKTMAHGMTVLSNEQLAHVLGSDYLNYPSHEGMMLWLNSQNQKYMWPVVHTKPKASVTTAKPFGEERLGSCICPT